MMNIKLMSSTNQSVIEESCIVIPYSRTRLLINGRFKDSWDWDTEGFAFPRHYNPGCYLFTTDVAFVLLLMAINLAREVTQTGFGDLRPENRVPSGKVLVVARFWRTGNI